jgi:hypothetical protein
LQQSRSALLVLRRRNLPRASITQIRPLLTPEQQTKLDAIIKAHEDLHNAMKELHEAKGK